MHTSRSNVPIIMFYGQLLVPLQGEHNTPLGASPEALRALRTFSEALFPNGRADVVPPADAELQSPRSDGEG